MANRLLLVNPRTTRKAVAPKPRRRKPAKRRKPVARKRRTAAQQAATRKMIAANRARARGGRRAPAANPRRRRKPVARRAPARRAVRRRRRRNPATAARQRRTYANLPMMNPRRKRRRNPRTRFNINSIMRDFVQPAAIGAVGAIANDALFTYLPLPVQLKMPGLPRYAGKAVSAVLMSWLASFVVRQQTATQLGVGALTCLTAEMARDFILTNIPAAAPVAMQGMGLYTNGLGYYNPAMPAGGGAKVSNNMGLYVQGGESRAQQLPSLATRETPGVGHYADGYNYG